MFTKGEKGNKALISFLNAFLAETYGEIKTADILNTELTRDIPSGETYHLDLLVKTDNRLVVNIEMQQFWKTDFPQRIQMYAFRMATQFLRKQPRADEPVYAISLTVFGEKIPKNAKLPKTDNSVLQYVYIDLNRLLEYTLKKDVKDYTKQDFWIRFLGNYKNDIKTKSLKALCKRSEGVNMANEVILTVTEEERQIARELSEYKYQLMVESERAEAREEGLVEGKKLGINKGLAEGRKEGKQEGLAEGEQRGIAIGRIEGLYQAKTKTAKNLLQIGRSVEQISKATGLAEEEIAKL